ncbi:hypothetical protein ACHAW6_000682 [Cyclotella cf. meneghiniana]
MLVIQNPVILLLPLGTSCLTTPLSFPFLVYSHARQGLRTHLLLQWGMVHEHRKDNPILNSASSAMGGFEYESKDKHDEIKILGVCGGIGSGKSTACKLMVDSLGCVDRIDADALAHQVYEPGSQSWKDIVSEFGEGILSQANNDTDALIDRTKLGSIVFGDNMAMSRLEKIVWPHLRAKIEHQIKEIKQKHQLTGKHDGGSFFNVNSNKIIIVEAALLLETGWDDLFDGIWFIQSSPSVAMRRLKEQRGLTEEEALARICAQQKRRGIGNGDKTDILRHVERGTVTAVITNDGTIMDLQNALKVALNDSVSFKK